MAATRVGSPSAPTGEADATGTGVGRSALATDGAEGTLTETDGKGERSDAGVAAEGEAVGSHASATTAAMTRAARTHSMVVHR